MKLPSAFCRGILQNTLAGTMVLKSSVVSDAAKIVSKLCHCTYALSSAAEKCPVV